MKKLILIVSFILIAVFFAGVMSGCAAKKNAADEILQSLDQNNEQVVVAMGKSSNAKLALLTSEDLTAEGLIALCIRPFPLSINMYKREFSSAVVRTELTAEQEAQIASLGKAVLNNGLLKRANLSGKGLVTICEHIGGINLNDWQIKKFFQNVIIETDLTAEEEVQIANLGNAKYNLALLLRPNLSVEALLAICEHPGRINFKNTEESGIVWRAILSASLTAEQEVEIAEKGNWNLNQALLARDNLTPEGFIAVCENPGLGFLGIQNEFSRFESARKRVELSDLSEDQKIRVANSRIYSGKNN